MLVVPRRSDKIATYPGCFHVIPAFMFQPKLEQDNPISEFSVQQQVKAEYLEELFNLEGKIPRKAGLTGISSIPEGAYLEELLSDPKRAQLLFTGVSMDLGNLRPEINMALVIHDQEWSQKVKGTKDHKPIKLSWECKSTIGFGEKGIIPLDAPLIQTFGSVDGFVPTGATTIQLGIQAANEEISALSHLLR